MVHTLSGLLKIQIQQALRYWVRDPAIGLLNTTIIASLKPLSINHCSAFGALIAPISVYRYPELDARARRNWRKLRPEQSDSASVDKAMKRLWRCISRTMTEFSVLHRLWDAGRITVEGLEHLDNARSAKKPILVAGLHLGNWEVIPLTGIALGHSGSGVYMPPNNRFDHKIAVRAMQRYGAVLFAPGPAAMRAAIKALTERTGPFVMFIDEYIRGHVFAPAFGRPLKPEGNIAYVARLARLTGAEIILAYCQRLNDSAYFKVTFLPPVDIARDGNRDSDLMENIARINSVIEPIVRANLDQWYYMLDLNLDV
jgi:KDO2-lipid IV(A) lauroyltransferase